MVLLDLGTKNLNWYVVLGKLPNNFVPKDPRWRSQKLNHLVLPRVLKHKHCSKVHHDYNEQVSGVKLLVVESV